MKTFSLGSRSTKRAFWRFGIRRLFALVTICAVCLWVGLLLIRSDNARSAVFNFVVSQDQWWNSEVWIGP